MAGNRVYVMGHGDYAGLRVNERHPSVEEGEVEAAPVFVPPGMELSFYADDDHNAVMPIGLAAVNAGLDPRDRCHAGTLVRNYRLTAFTGAEVAAYTESLSSVTDGAVYFVGATPPVDAAELWLCTEPLRCRDLGRRRGGAHVPECEGLLTRLAGKDIRLVACRRRTRVEQPGDAEPTREVEGDTEDYSHLDVLDDEVVRILEWAHTDRQAAFAHFCSLPQATRAALYNTSFELQSWVSEMNHPTTEPCDQVAVIWDSVFSGDELWRTYWRALPDATRRFMVRYPEVADWLRQNDEVDPFNPPRVGQDFTPLDAGAAEVLAAAAEADPAAFLEQWRSLPDTVQEMLLSSAPRLLRWLVSRGEPVQEVPTGDRVTAEEVLAWAAEEHMTALRYWHGLSARDQQRLLTHDRVRNWLVEAGQLAEPNPPGTFDDCMADPHWREAFWRWLHADSGLPGEEAALPELHALLTFVDADRLEEVRAVVDYCRGDNPSGVVPPVDAAFARELDHLLTPFDRAAEPPPDWDEERQSVFAEQVRHLVENLRSSVASRLDHHYRAFLDSTT